MIVSSSAIAAATAMIGTSSISSGIMLPANSVPRRLLVVATTSATGSPATSRSSTSSIFPPMSCRAVITPARVGLMPTPLITTSALG